MNHLIYMDINNNYNKINNFYKNNDYYKKIDNKNNENKLKGNIKG